MEKFNELFRDCTSAGVKIKKEDYLEQGKYPIIDQGQNIIAGYSNNEDGLFTDVPAIIFGDHTRVIKYVDTPFFLGADGVKVLKCKKQDANYKYLYYALRNARIPNTGYNRHFKWLKELEIFYPDTNEQARIVEVLDKISSIAEQRKYQMQQMDELVKSRFIEMFGDANIEKKFTEVQFGECTKGMLKGPFGSDMKKDLYVPKGEDTYKVYIQINAIQKNQNLGEYYISKEYFDRKIYRFELKPGDYIVTCDGTLGKLLRLDENMEKGVISSSLLRITLDEDKIVPEYFESIWNYYMLGKMASQARNACLVHLPSAKVISAFEIPLPPIKLQNQFADFVQQVDKQKVILQQSLAELETQFQALMQEAFKG